MALKTVDDVLLSMTSFVTKTYDPKGELMPMWTLVDKDGQCFVYVTPFDGEDSKDAVNNLIRSMCRKHNATMIGFMSEVWTYKAPKGTSPEDARRIVPSEQPDRQEAVLFIAETIDGECRFGHMAIIRNAEGD